MVATVSVCVCARACEKCAVSVSFRVPFVSVCAREVHTACALEEGIEACVNRHTTLIVVIARKVLHAAPSLGFRV
jgi:hypothetical protein